MSDLIRRGNAIAILEDLQSKHLQFCLVPFRIAIEKVQAIPSADRWIPCSERLPNRQGHYICTCKDGSKYKRTTVVKWSNGWQLTGTRSYWIVVAWMPLPEPWKGADDE